MIWRKSCFASLILMITGVGYGQTAIQNPSFEQGELGGIPIGWHNSQFATNAGYRLEITETGCYAGPRCALLTGIPKAESDSFGNLIQTVQAKDFLGHSVKLKAAIRVEGANTRAQMWLRLDRADGSMVSIDNMSGRPVTAKEWRAYETNVFVPADVDKIVIGVMQFGPGKAWVDDVDLADTGEVKIEGPRVLTTQGLRNLTAFAKLYGYVRFFHPSDQTVGIDWKAFAVDGVRQVESATDDAQLTQQLTALFTGVAPTVQIFGTKSGPVALPAALRPSEGEWKHIRIQNVGVGLQETTTPGAYNAYYSVRKTVDASGPLPAPFRAALVDGISASVPLTLPTNADGTLPHIPKPKLKQAGLHSSADRAARIASIIIAWNVFEHFYPYFDVVKVDWPAELARALTTAASDGPDEAFTRSLLRLVAALKDGHGYVSGPGANGSPFDSPVHWDWIEKQAVVTQVSASVNNVATGDRVLSIDGRNIDEVLAEKVQLISAATPQYLNWRVNREMSRCIASKKAMDLEIEPFNARGTRKAVTVACESSRGRLDSPTEERPAMTAELEPGIFYIDLQRITMLAWTELMPKLEVAKGMIFDLRGYPNQVALDVLAHLADKEIRSAKWNIPKPELPDRVDLKFVESGWPVMPKLPHLKAPAAFLIDGRAISYAETVMGIVEHFKLAQIVGQPTAGTNGNINPFLLPTGHTVTWSGMKVLKHDGSQHHGIGILPTVPVERTRRGVADKKDEILLRAIEVVKAGGK